MQCDRAKTCHSWDHPGPEGVWTAETCVARILRTPSGRWCTILHWPPRGQADGVWPSGHLDGYHQWPHPRRRHESKYVRALVQSSPAKARDRLYRWSAVRILVMRTWTEAGAGPVRSESHQRPGLPVGIWLPESTRIGSSHGGERSSHVCDHHHRGVDLGGWLRNFGAPCRTTTWPIGSIYMAPPDSESPLRFVQRTGFENCAGFDGCCFTQAYQSFSREHPRAFVNHPREPGKSWAPHECQHWQGSRWQVENDRSEGVCSGFV